MPTSSSSSSSSSSSFSSSSSSSFHGFTVSTSAVETYGKFEILTQTGNTFLINTGVAYDGYGNRLELTERQLVALDFPPDLSSDGSPAKQYGFLCVRRKLAYRNIDYMDNPITVLPNRTKYDTAVEFYIVAGVIGVNFGTAVAYYPPLDSNGVIGGIVLGKVYVGALAAPDMVNYRSPQLVVKNGQPMPLNGFNLG